MSHTKVLPLALFPAEIKILVLSSMSDYESMKSLAHTSSSYHQAYLKAQEDILHHVTTNTLREVGLGLLDPWSAIHAPRLGMTVPNRMDIINAFLDDYGQGRLSGNQRLSIEDSLNILSLHIKIKFIIDNFCQVNLSRNPLYISEGLQLGPGYQSSLVPQPSYTEIHRLYRAFWRWALYSKLFFTNAESLSRFDAAQRASGAHTENVHHAEDVASDFLGSFPIHEVEEIASLYSFIKHQFEGIFRPFSIDPVIDLGPAFVYSIMVAPSKQDKHDIIYSMPPRFGPTMRNTLHAYEWIVSGGQGWPRKTTKKSLRVDSVPTDGWLWASLRGAQNTDYRLRRWGYVFWDRIRLDEWGVNQQRLLNWPWPKRDTDRRG